MNTKFCELQPYLMYLEEQVKNKSIYLWGAQGEVVSKLTIGKINKDETSRKNVKRVLDHISENELDEKFDPEVARAFDCSGLGSFWLQNTEGVVTWDHNANAFMHESVIIEAKYRQPGDFVFSSISDKGVAGHIGYVVEDLTVTESRGRDYGVVNRPYADGKWKKVGRPPYFAYEMTRELSKGCKGNDVGQLQARLTSFGYPCGDVDNDFGTKTATALKAFQKAKKLTADGVMGQKTAEKLGFKWMRKE